MFTETDLITVPWTGAATQIATTTEMDKDITDLEDITFSQAAYDSPSGRPQCLTMARIEWPGLLSAVLETCGLFLQRIMRRIWIG